MKREEGENDIEMREKLSRKKKKYSYPNKFQNKWLVRFSPWLSRCKDTDIGAFCRICQTKIAGSVTLIERHKRTRKHINKCLKFGLEEMGFDDDSKEKNELGDEKAHLLSINDDETINIIAEDIDQNFSGSLGTLTASNLDRQRNVRIYGKSPSLGKTEKKYDINYEKTHTMSLNDEEVLNSSVEKSDQYYSDPLSSPSANVLNRHGNTITKDKRVDYKHILEQLASNLQQEDEYDLFAKSIASQLRKLPEDSAVSLIADVQNLVSQRRLKYLNDSKSQQHSVSPQVITVPYENNHFDT